MQILQLVVVQLQEQAVERILAMKRIPPLKQSFESLL